MTTQDSVRDPLNLHRFLEPSTLGVKPKQNCEIVPLQAVRDLDPLDLFSHKAGLVVVCRVSFEKDGFAKSVVGVQI